MKEETTQAPREDIAAGLNGVSELLAGGREVEALYCERDTKNPAVRRLCAIARDRKIPIKQVNPQKLTYMCGTQYHQGVAAVISAARYSTLEEILDAQRGEDLFLIIADGIEDPHNLGAVIRTAEAAGAHGLIIPKRGSAGLTATVSKTSAGAVEHLPVARVPNISECIKKLKKRGIWIFCADMDGRDYTAEDYSCPLALVIGSEGRGVSRLVKENCDVTVSLPMYGKVNSLNASVAAALLMYEVARSRRKR